MNEIVDLLNRFKDYELIEAWSDRGILIINLRHRDGHDVVLDVTEGRVILEG